MSEISISEGISLGDEIFISRLLRQLSPYATAVSFLRLEEVAADCALLLARNSKKEIVGMATLTIVKKLTGTFGTVEDVVVDKDYRGNGIGRRLVDNLIVRAKNMYFLSYVELTSHPSRSMANSLCRSMGFEERETNVYRRSFE